MRIYTIMGNYPDQYGNFTLTAGQLGLAAAGHLHVIGDVDNLQASLDGKSPVNHTHTAMSAIYCGDRKMTGLTAWSGNGMALTVAGQDITFSAAVDVSVSLDNAPAAVNYATRTPCYFFTGDYAALFPARRGRGYSLAALTDEAMLMAATAKLARPVVDAFVWLDGAKTAVAEIATDDGIRLYPVPAAYKLRIQTPLDDGKNFLAADGEQYPLPLIDGDVESIEVTVTPYPANAQWYFDSENFELPAAVKEVIFTGKQTIQLELPAIGAGKFLYRLLAKPRGWIDGREYQTLSFWRQKVISTAGTPLYYWPLNGDFVEVNTGKTGRWLETADPAWSSDNLAVKGKSFGPTAVGSGNNDTTGFICEDVPVDLTGGATLSFFYRYYAANFSAWIGYIDRTNTNTTSGNHFGVAFGYAQLTAALLYNSAGKISSRFTASKWHHVALVITPEVTEGHTSEELKRNYYYEFKLYHDGELIDSGAKSLIRDFHIAGKDALHTAGGGVFTIGLRDAKEQSNNLYYDEIKVYDHELSLSDVRGEAALAGFTFEDDDPDAGGGDTPKPTAKPDEPRNREGLPEDIAAAPIPAALRVYVIDARTVAVGGYFGDFYSERLRVEYPQTVANMEYNYRHGLRPLWKYEFYYNFSVSELQKDYEPLIIDRYDSDDHFQVDGAAVAWLGAWSNSCGLLFVDDAYDQTRKVATDRADIAHFAYLRLPEPMADGSEHTITDADGNTASFTYGRGKPVSSIKVNQVGYVPGCTKKYAYLGFWLGSGGAHDFGLEDMTFHLVDAATGATVYTGAMTGRGAAETCSQSGVNYTMTGETVYQMNFGDFASEGEYQVYVPGVGYSWPFKISPDVGGEMFYTHCRGLYHQRSGVAKGEPYTKWPAAKSQGQTYEALFFPSREDYWMAIAPDGTNWGDTYGTDAFPMTTRTKTNKALRDVYGGWWDAADWDRRDYHLWAINDLCHAYLLFPQNFADNQLNIPESGDGIPDILSEAIWGTDVWRRAQDPDGGVGCWIESTSHPTGMDAAEVDGDRFYLARATGSSSLRYALSAAMLGCALQKAGTPAALKKADLFVESAIRAFDYGVADHAPFEFDVTNNGRIVTYTYTENTDYKQKYILWAALMLYKATGEQKYSHYLTVADEIPAGYTCSNWDAYLKLVTDDSFTHSMMIDICDMGDEFPILAQRMREIIIDKADTWLARQEKQTYRNLAWEPGDWRMFYNGWGACHSATRGGNLVYAWLLTGEQEYFDAACNAMDWMAGCNALGRSMTTGLGKVCPSRHLSKINDLLRTTQGIGEPVPGITPYMFEQQLHAAATTHVYGLFKDARGDCAFSGAASCHIPGRVRTTVTNTRGVVAGYLQSKVPVWRKTVNVQDQSVSNSEFTIWETVSRNVLMTAMMMSPGWTPSDALVNRAPIADEKEIEGFISLP